MGRCQIGNESDESRQRIEGYNEKSPENPVEKSYGIYISNSYILFVI